MSELTVIIHDVENWIVKVEDWIKGINWATVAADFQKVIKTLETAVEPVLEALFPGTTSLVADVVNPLLAQANTAVTALTGAAQAYAAGTLTASALTTTAHSVQGAVVAANAIVSVALAGTKPATPATGASATTVAKPATTATTSGANPSTLAQ